jgi:hypothetical protein
MKVAPMESFVRKIFEKKIDESVHLQFQKFSRGAFKYKALLKATHSSKGYSLYAGNEFANELVRLVAMKLGNEKTTVTGVIVSTSDLKGKIPSTDLKQFMGIKQYIINGEMSGNEIVTLQDAFPDVFFALSFTAGDTILKIKPKAPKSAKPKTSEAPPKADFCNVKTNDKQLVEAFIWEQGWKTIEINHTFDIKDIELPHGAKDPNELRKLAKRKGVLIRNALIDGKESTKEATFVA